MTEKPKTQIALRLNPDLLDQIDQRIAMVNEAKPALNLSRNAWFENMAKWVIYRLPHEAVRADLIKAWPEAPKETLGVDG